VNLRRTRLRAGVEVQSARVCLGFHKCIHQPTLTMFTSPFIGYRLLLDTRTMMPRGGGGTCWEYSTTQCTLTRALWKGPHEPPLLVRPLVKAHYQPSTGPRLLLSLSPFLPGPPSMPHKSPTRPPTTAVEAATSDSYHLHTKIGKLYVDRLTQPPPLAGLEPSSQTPEVSLTSA
jgi:hypothetical protein